MQNIILRKILVIIFILFSSCQQIFFPIYIENATKENVDIDILKPASVSIDPEIVNLIVVANPNTSAFKAQIDSNLIDTNLCSKTNIFGEITSICNDLIISSPRFNIIEVPFSKIGNLSEIQANNNIDGFLVLSGFQISSKTRLKKEYNLYADNYTAYYTETEFKINSQWELTNKNLKVIETKNTEFFEKIFSEKFSLEEEAWNNTPNLNEHLNYGLFVLCDKMVSHIAPVWKSVNRDFFSTGNKEFRNATTLIQQQQWDMAIDTWSKLTQSDNYITKKHATYNMILGYEMKENLDSAILMANKSIWEFKIDEAAYYKIDLEERQHEILLINEQLYLKE